MKHFHLGRLDSKDWMAPALKQLHPLVLPLTFVTLVACSLAIRISLVHVKTSDYIIYLAPWIHYLSNHGIHAFRYNFANYNTPYLLLLLLGTYLHLPALAIVKGISIAFDLVLAAAVYLLIRTLRPSGNTKWFVALGVLFLPTVIINSSLWGQCDAIYTSFLILALTAALRDRSSLAWILIGVSFAFKLQAIFFVPFLLFYHLYRGWRWEKPIYGLLVFGLLSFLPIVEGRGFISTFSVYLHQTDPTSTKLTLGAPTFYTWLPNLYFHELRNAGIVLGGSVAIGIILLGLSIKHHTQQSIILLSMLILIAVPFFLPQMHERYFYAAEIMSLVAAIVIPRLAWICAGLQVITLAAYLPYLSNGNQVPFVPLGMLALAMLFIMGMVVRELLITTKTATGLVDDSQRLPGYTKRNSSTAKRR